MYMYNLIYILITNRAVHHIFCWTCWLITQFYPFVLNIYSFAIMGWCWYIIFKQWWGRATKEDTVEIQHWFSWRRTTIGNDLQQQHDGNWRMAVAWNGVYSEQIRRCVAASDDVSTRSDGWEQMLAARNGGWRWVAATMTMKQLKQRSGGHFLFI